MVRDNEQGFGDKLLELFIYSFIIDFSPLNIYIVYMKTSVAFINKHQFHKHL